VRFERDVLGLELARVLPGEIRVEWQRDESGRPTARHTVRRGAVTTKKLEEQTYEWRGDDQIAAIIDSRRGPLSYTHDQRGRLVAQQSRTGTLHRVMDAVGNVYRTPRRTDRRYAPGGRLEEADGERYVHDEDGHQIERQDADGARWRYHWNGAGLLSEVERPDGGRVRFEYDAFARRTRKALIHLGPDAEETLESETRFVWDGDTVLHEVSTGAPVTTWYWEPSTFTPVLKEHGDRRWSLASDHLGTPTEMYDEAGKLTWAMRLDIFGVPSFDAGAASDCPWRWPGQYEDTEQDSYYQRWRFFDPRRHRFLSKDPLGLEGGLNPFQYVEAPLEQIDPLGLAPLVVIGEGMDLRVTPAARSLDAHEIGSVWDRNDKPYLEQNRRWIREQIADRAVFVDLGRDGRPRAVDFYGMEIDELTRAGYTRTTGVTQVKGLHGRKVPVPPGTVLWHPPRRTCT
jgi:RHS repeat-associated protein